MTHGQGHKAGSVRELPVRRAAATSLIERAFDAAQIGMAISDPFTFRFLRVNDAMCELLGRTREELMRLTVMDVSHPEDLESVRQVHHALLDTGVSGLHTEKRYTRPDGSAFWAAVHVSPIYSDEGTVEAFLGQKVDITERKEREAHLARYVNDAEWLGRTRDAIDQDRLVLYSQPIVDLHTGETVQRELLLRMQDENGAIVPPGDFLPVAERYGLISEIDRWVIRQALRLAADGTPTEFNLSAASIGNPDVLHELAHQITTTGIDPALLIVEITETAMLHHADEAGALAERLQALGCGLALDDFGTGFASLSYLKRLHAQYLKIDIEFVRDVARCEEDQRLIRGIVGLAREFGLTTVAEGIEDEETLATVRALGVDRGQGYLFARPAPLPGNPLARAGKRRRLNTGPDPVATVRAAFQAFTDRDFTSAQRLIHPALVLRPLVTSTRAEADGAYRGHEGLARYFEDVQETWDELHLAPSTFWECKSAVIAFGRVRARRNGSAREVDALWVFRLRDGLIASIHGFDPPDLVTTPVTGPGD